MKPVLPKRILATLITTLFLFSLNLVPANGVPCYIVVGTVLTDGGTCTGALVIDDTVTSIASGAFLDNTALTSVTIPNSVTIIQVSAFEGNTALTSVIIGNSVTSIGANAFYGNTALFDLRIGNSVTSIGVGAFSDNTALTSVTIPDSVITIGEDAFFRTSLTTLNIPNSVTTIYGSAFASVSTLSSVTIGNSVTTIESDAFTGTTVNSFTFSGNAPASVADNAFPVAIPPATANVAYNATGFPANGSIWKQLSVVYGSAPGSNDSGSTTASVTTPTIVKTADVVFNLKNKKYLSKDAMKTKLSKNKSFKRNPKDLYKYSIFGTSKKTCLMRGNNVMALKKTGSCDLYAIRTTPKGAKYKYWVKINYVK